MCNYVSTLVVVKNKTIIGLKLGLDVFCLTIGFVKNKTIIGLKCWDSFTCQYTQVKNKTIIGLK